MDGFPWQGAHETSPADSYTAPFSVWKHPHSADTLCGVMLTFLDNS